MTTVQKIVRNLYRDSVSLMQFSAQVAKLPGVQQASAVMATENNLSLLREAGLLTGQLEAKPNDLLIVLQGDDEAALAVALQEAEVVLNQSPQATSSGPQRIHPRSIEMALAELPTANLALIATPGEYAAAEALKALHLGLHVMLFSDNVTPAEEIMLKQYARDHNLMVMGPDCGTAIINGIPLGFANVVRRGDIGLVAASGTGLQQVTCLIDRWGKGVSQAIGTGGHDLHSSVGGISMLQGLKALIADPATRVIVLISKPPSPDVTQRVLEQASQAGKPVVVNFLGADPAAIQDEGIFAARTLEEAAAMAVALSDGRQPDQQAHEPAPELIGAMAAEAQRLSPRQQYIRGLYSGGTFCYEALLLLAEAVGPVYSNIPLEAQYRLADVWQSQQHTVIDLGDDLFTRGRPHPMIDQRLRNERILKEAADLEVAVILLDVVLGYGSHPDPAREIVPTIQQARKVATEAGRQLIFVGSVCGTLSDPQNRTRQETALHEAGVLLADSNAQAVRLAASVLRVKL
jgi:succinyl-CoA synthetase alpha subunit